MIGFFICSSFICFNFDGIVKMQWFIMFNFNVIINAIETKIVIRSRPNLNNSVHRKYQVIFEVIPLLSSMLPIFVPWCVRNLLHSPGWLSANFIDMATTCHWKTPSCSASDNQSDVSILVISTCKCFENPFMFLGNVYRTRTVYPRAASAASNHEE